MTCFVVGILMSLCALAGVVSLERGPQSPVPLDAANVAVQVGTVSAPAITEASGMAYSRARRGMLWIANDSGNGAELFCVTTGGDLAGVVAVEGVSNRDWEDLAAFRLGDTPLLLIADVGDNLARHAHCTLLIVEDPLPAEGPPRLPDAVAPAWTIRFRYPDGPRDCEAVAVDAARERILLLSKRTEPPALYAVPLRPPPEGGVVNAERLGDVPTIPAPFAEDLADAFGQFWAQPTGMDLAEDGRSLVVVTYKHAYRYTRGVHEDWVAALARTPETLRLPHPSTGIMRIREAIAIDPDTGNVYITSEGSPSPLYRVRPQDAR
jgi:hypothetical protein